MSDVSTVNAALQVPSKVLRVLAIAAEDHGLTPDDLTSGSGSEAIEAARRQATATFRRQGYNPVDIRRFLRCDKRPRIEPPPTDTNFVLLPPKVRGIMEKAARRNGILLRSLLGTSRQQDVTRARKEASRELRSIGYSYLTIGRYLHVHHTTVVYHVMGRPGGVRPAAGQTRAGAVPVPDYSGEWAI